MAKEVYFLYTSLAIDYLVPIDSLKLIGLIQWFFHYARNNTAAFSYEDSFYLLANDSIKMIL